MSNQPAPNCSATSCANRTFDPSGLCHWHRSVQPVYIPTANQLRLTPPSSTPSDEYEYGILTDEDWEFFEGLGTHPLPRTDESNRFLHHAMTGVDPRLTAATTGNAELDFAIERYFDHHDKIELVVNRMVNQIEANKQTQEGRH